MSAVTRMPLMILAVWVWVAMVQSECITNPMDEINRKAQERYQITDEFLVDMKRSSMNEYHNLLRVYGIYRACVEGGTKRWMDNEDGSSSCPYCRTKIEDEDKITTPPKWPAVNSSIACATVTFCRSPHEQYVGYYYRVRGTYAECESLGYHTDLRDPNICPAEGNTNMQENLAYRDEWLKTLWCPIICGYCGLPCGFFCSNYGYMNDERCTCICHIQYSGKRCEKLDCSDALQDNRWCNTYSKKNCGETFVSTTCPKLCGLCDKQK